MVNARRHISYAASLADLPSNEKDVRSFLQLVKSLDVISVREEATRVFLCNNGVPNVRVDLDPVLLLQPSEWTGLFPDKVLFKYKYILYYDLQSDACLSSFDEQEVLDFAKRNQCKLIRVRGFATKIGSRYDRHHDSPETFINLIRHADCVVTSSYHGLVLSMLFNRPVICRFSRYSERAQSFLHEMGAEDRLLQIGSSIPMKIRPIDPLIEDRLKILRTSSLAFLRGLAY